MPAYFSGSLAPSIQAGLERTNRGGAGPRCTPAIVAKEISADVISVRILILPRWDTITAMANTAASIAQALANAGIDRVFGLPGGEILVLMDELRRAGIDFVLMRHESNAGIAAGVYGKLRGQPGVVLTTLGPGAANLMLPISNS